MIFVNGGKEYQRKRVTDLAWFVCKKFNMEPILDINIRDLTSEGSLGFCTEFDEGEYALGLDFGASVGIELIRRARVFPVGATRLKVIKRSGTTVYMGLTTSPYNADGDLVFGLVYGVGTKF